VTPETGAAATVASGVDRTATATPTSEGDLRSARKELARLERTIGRLEQREAQLHEDFAANATDYTRVTELDEQLRAVRAEREIAELQWLELAERIS
jgi:hypothetical protein